MASTKVEQGSGFRVQGLGFSYPFASTKAEQEHEIIGKLDPLAHAAPPCVAAALARRSILRFTLPAQC